MGNQASRKRTPERRRTELYELYLRRSDRINDWDLVDISAHQVVGGYLLDKPRDVLYQLARSPRWWQRRIAMFATLVFVRTGDLDDTFALAEMLVHDEHDLVRKVVGGMLREAGKHDRARLLGSWIPMPPRRRGCCCGTRSSSSTPSSGRTTWA
jgi:3-methyladenine DNA glycosylase AlkD